MAAESIVRHQGGQGRNWARDYSDGQGRSVPLGTVPEEDANSSKQNHREEKAGEGERKVKVAASAHSTIKFTLRRPPLASFLHPRHDRPEGLCG